MVVREEDLKLEHLTGTFMGLEGQTEAQTKALDTLNLIWERGADALDAYEDRSDSLVGAQKELAARLAEVRSELAQKMTPAFLGAFEAADKLLSHAEVNFNSFVGLWSGAADQQVAFIDANRWLAQVLREGRDPVLAYETAIGHVARVGDITREKVDALRATAGLTDEQFEASRETLIAYAESGADAEITVEEFNEALGINAERQAAVEAKARELVGTHEDLATKMREAEARERALYEARFLTEEQAEELAKDTMKLTAEYERHAEQARKVAERYRLDMTPAFSDFVTMFDGKVDELEVSIEELEQLFAEQQEQNERFFSSLSILAAAGLDDLVAELEAKGPAAAAQAEAYVANIDAAFDQEAALERGQMLADAYARGISTSLTQGLPPVLEVFREAGIDMARALENGFDSTILGGSFFFDVSFETHPGAFVGGNPDAIDNGGVVIE